MKLDLIWTAVFDDGKVIYQFNDLEQKQEHLFKEVLEYHNKSRLICFKLTNDRTHRDYDVDLVSGKFHFHNSILSSKMSPVSAPENEVRGDKKYRYRLIYFRRVTRTMTWAGKEISDQGVQDIQYFLGFQYTNEKGENVKRLLQISKDDEVYLV